MHNDLTIIENGTVLTPAGFRETSVLLDGDLIRALGDAADTGSPPGARRVDAGGLIVLPGLIDLHVHGAAGLNLLDEELDAPERIAACLARHGTTAFLATTLYRTDREEQPHLERIAELATRHAGGAAVLGIHLEGPFINPKKRGMVQPHYIAPPSDRVLDEVRAACGGRLRMMTLAPELPGMTGLIPRLARNGVVPALGHTNATLEEMERGIRAGAGHVTHVTNAMRPFHHREPGALGAVLMRDDLTMQIIPDGAHLHPRVVRWLVELKAPERFALITDGTRALGMPPGRFTRGEFELEVGEDGAARDPDGTLVGTALPQLHLVERMSEIAAIPLAEAVRMASLYPARVLGIEAQKGSITTGSDADLVLCRPHPLRAERVFIGGQPVLCGT